ncbi:HU family DNA-binding protein [Runella sp.]|uniref:HU family DNA-binding protein n=1 Tax=Runella sp. TaxID=1960881 RepID=UPI003D106B90
MTKADIVTQIYYKSKDLPKPEIATIVDALFEVIKEKVAARQTIYLRGFGNFFSKYRSLRKARNVKKNVEIIVDPYHSPAFKPSQEMIKKVKNETAKISQKSTRKAR